MPIIDLIMQKKETLTKKQEMVAEYMISHQEEMGYVTLKELSKATGVTEITILNTCQALGFDGFSALKYEFRKDYLQRNKLDVIDQSSQYIDKIPSYETSRKEKLIQEVADEEIRAITEFRQNLDLREIFQAADMILNSERIMIFGRGVSYTLAELLRNHIGACDIFSTVINTELNEYTYSALSAVDDQTLVIVFSFPDYYFMTTKVAAFAESKHAAVLAVTDRDNAEVSRYANLTLSAPSVTRVFMNTLSAPAMLLNLLTSAVKIQQDGRKNGIEQVK